MDRNDQDQILRLSRRIKELLEADIVPGLPVIVNGDGNIIVNDTRGDAPPTDIGDMGARFDFKANTADGLNDGGSYHGVLTFQQWKDQTGGSIHQVGFTDNGNVWHRKAAIGGAWNSSWAKVWDESNFDPNSRAVCYMTTEPDLDNITTGGIYRLGAVTHGFPNASWSNLLVIRGGGDTIAQVGFPYTTDEIYFRRGSTSTFKTNPWKKIWHDGNLNPIQGVSDGNYYGVKLPDGSTSNWLRTTVNGIIPYESGGASALGTASYPFNAVFTKSLDAGSYAQSLGRSTSWGVTSSEYTGAFNARMGTATGATWLLSGTSGGSFRYGIQGLDSGGALRFYNGGVYYNLDGSSGSIYHGGKIQFRTGQCTLKDSDWTQVNFTSAMSGTPRVTGTSNQDLSAVRNVKVKSVSANGFQAILGGSATGNTLCDYIAVWQ